MSTRLDDHVVRKEVAEKLAYIRAHMLGYKAVTPFDKDEDTTYRNGSQGTSRRSRAYRSRRRAGCSAVPALSPPGHTEED